MMQEAAALTARDDAAFAAIAPMTGVSDPATLANEGTNLFSSTVAAQPAGPEARLEPAAIERSNVKAVVELTRLMEVQRTYQSIANMINKSDELRSRAISRLADQQA